MEIDTEEKQGEREHGKIRGVCLKNEWELKQIQKYDEMVYSETGDKNGKVKML